MKKLTLTVIALITVLLAGCAPYEITEKELDSFMERIDMCSIVMARLLDAGTETEKEMTVVTGYGTVRKTMTDRPDGSISVRLESDEWIYERIPSAPAEKLLKDRKTGEEVDIATHQEVIDSLEYAATGTELEKYITSIIQNGDESYHAEVRYPDPVDAPEKVTVDAVFRSGSKEIVLEAGCHTIGHEMYEDGTVTTDSIRIDRMILPGSLLEAVREKVDILLRDIFDLTT